MEIFTIGFTEKSAADFFGRLRRAGIRRLVDVRLNNVSQPAGFAKREDLAFFLREICGADYEHEPLLAPTPDLLDAYKKRAGRWADYERDFLALMTERKIEARRDSRRFEAPTVLLCSEDTADRRHRRLVAEYLRGKWQVGRCRQAEQNRDDQDPGHEAGPEIQLLRSCSSRPERSD